MQRRKFVTFLLGICGSSVLAACSITEAAPPPGPTVGMAMITFDPETINVKKGESIILRNDTEMLHVITNGTWDESVAKPGKEEGAPTINVNVSGKNATKALGPFDTAGTFELYCTVHVGMNLTVNVQ